MTGLQKSFELLAVFPGIGRFADELLPGLKRHRFQAHHIFYTIEPGHILIRALVHQSKVVRPPLFDD